MSSAAPSKRKIGPAIGRLASGVYIVTVDVAGKKMVCWLPGLPKLVLIRHRW